MIGFIWIVVCRNWLQPVLILKAGAGIWMCECDAGHCCYACSWLVGRRIFNDYAFVREFSPVVMLQWEFCNLELAHDLFEAVGFEFSPPAYCPCSSDQVECYALVIHADEYHWLLRLVMMEVGATCGMIPCARRLKIEVFQYI